MHLPLVTTPLVLMAPRADGIQAVWAVSRLSKGKILCESDDGPTKEYSTNRYGFVPQGEKVLKVRLDGLKSGRAYRIKSITTAADNDEQHISEWKHFQTLDAKSNSTHFVIWNDTHNYKDTIEKLHSLTPSADFLLWNGDMCNDWHSSDLLIPTLLNPGGCDISNGHPLFLTFGNHDVRGPYAFEIAKIAITPTRRPFYSFRSGPIAVICLNTGEDKPDSHPSFKGRAAFNELRLEQAEWLAKEIQGQDLKDAPYRIVFCHIPLRLSDETPPNYETGGFDRFSLCSRQLWHPSLIQWKTQMIISGHTHRSTFIPGTIEFPYHQLIGGGPGRNEATWIEVKADKKQAIFTVRNLENLIKHEFRLKPLHEMTVI